MTPIVLDGTGGAVLRSLFKDLKFGTASPMENEEIRFGRFGLDLRRRELRCDGQPVRMLPLP